MRRGSGPFTGWPSTMASPFVCFKKPPTILSNVDLPQPEGPTMQTNSPSVTSRSTRSSTWICSPGRLPAKLIHRSRTETAARGACFSGGFMRFVSAIRVTPAHFIELFELAHEHVQNQANQPDHHHARHDEIVALARIARVDDQIAESRVHRDHFRRDDDQPGDAQGDAHARDDLRKA